MSFIDWAYGRNGQAEKAGRYEESKHPRQPKGHPKGGEYADKPGAGDDAPKPPVTWKGKVRKVYSDLEELRDYDETYGIVKRLGYDDAESLWNDNPLIGGSTDPAALRVIAKKKKT